MSNKPTHRIIYVTDRVEVEGEEFAKEYTTEVGAAWLSDGGAMRLSFKLPVTILPGDRNLKILPIKD